jgi:type IV pilus assembly protein PilB
MGLGGVTSSALASALSAQERSGGRIGEILIRSGSTDEELVARALSLQLTLPYAAPPLHPTPEVAVLVSPDMIRERAILPLSATSRTLRLAMADPLDLSVLDDLRFQLSRRIVPEVASSTAIHQAASRLAEGQLSELLRQLPERLVRLRESDRSVLEEAARAAPVVRLVDHVLNRAVGERASDIHAEVQEEHLCIRFRIDGVLTRIMELPRATHGALLSRIKVMAGMDISVKRRPQDGGFQHRHSEGLLNIRVSTLPSEGGEKAVMRILDPDNAPTNLDSLGFSDRDLDAVRALLRAGQGVILAAGPTGSGKSSSLFGALGELDREALNIVTLEDPIEYRVTNVHQVQMDPKAGLTFPAALRSVLRQDPDVVMVGEIRDRETAEIAMTAAVTGHLVLSTIHTIDAPSAVTRLLNMGVPPFLVAGGLSGVIAQRLVRRLCPHCRGHPEGCVRCVLGFRGRTGVFQVLAMSDELRDEVMRGASTTELRRLSSKGGMRSLAEDARRKVAEGVTGDAEVSRVLRADPSVAFPCDSCGTSVPMGALGCPECGRVRTHMCVCGEETRTGWRFCPWCLRKRYYLQE